MTRAMPSFLDKRRVVVLGLGMTGLSAARWALANGASVRVADTRAAPARAGDLRADLPGVELVCGPFTDATFAGAELIVLSPGLSKDHPAIRSAVARGVELVGDIELFARALPTGQKVLAITGSNGKSTVTLLTTQLLRATGLDAVAAGNIGEPVLDVLSAYSQGKRWPDVFVLELSSFQLETTWSLAPVSSAVLNVSANHLDRYADIAAYAAAKSRIFYGGGEQVLNRDDPLSMAMRLPDRALRCFGRGIPETEDEWGLVPRKGASWLARGGALLLPAHELALVGQHNALNALASLALISSVAKVDRRVLAALCEFRGLAHRMERVGEKASEKASEKGGISFVNDSKATTVAATAAALSGYGRNVVLIAGGDGKGQDFAALAPEADAHCRAVVLIGRDGPALGAALTGIRAGVEFASTLEAAVERAIDLAQAGDTVLLSPACASLDMFRSFEERGDRFKAAVNAHIGESTHA